MKTNRTDYVDLGPAEADAVEYVMSTHGHVLEANTLARALEHDAANAGARLPDRVELAWPLARGGDAYVYVRLRWAARHGYLNEVGFARLQEVAAAGVWPTDRAARINIALACVTPAQPRRGAA